MVDVVDMSLVLAQIQDVLDRVDVVERIERHLILGYVLIKLAIDAEPADLAEAIAIRVEELLVEEFARLFQLRRIAGAKPLVNAQKSAFVIASLGPLASD